MKVSELLAQARDELFKGWVSGKLLDVQSGGVCAVGALRRATMSNIQNGSSAVFWEARTELNRKACEMSNSRFDLVEHFNDHFASGKQDMLDLFDKAIVSVEEVGK